MSRPDRGTSPRGFRDQLLARLRNTARELGVAPQRLQSRVAFERLLVRLSGTDDWTLKGGFALELRYGWANRPTRDIDLRTPYDTRRALGLLRKALSEADSADHFSFDLGDTEQEMQGAPGGTVRVRVIARVAGLVFSEFHLDLSSGDAVVGPADMLEGLDLLGFAGLAPMRFPVYPVTQHLAEKLHAYTLPRDRENTRVKDLIDLVVMASSEDVQGSELLSSLDATFEARSTHPLPDALPRPPESWSAPYRSLTRESPASTPPGLKEADELAICFWSPVLSRSVRAKRWLAKNQEWTGAV
jgi:predicted nucleotidyltransferase component of viral defense system